MNLLHPGNDFADIVSVESADAVLVRFGMSNPLEMDEVALDRLSGLTRPLPRVLFRRVT